MDELVELLEEAKRIADSRGLHLIVYLLACAELELTKGKPKALPATFGEPPEPIRPFDRDPENDN